MFDDSKICPYTGLRPFSEEESLYFKGRDENIEQATKQLEKNKFLILTGASGDGKSSLIFAGVIPNARSGFLKSRFSNWAVADFRPERTPFKNLCSSVALQLGISNIETVEAELSRGFSALVDLYKASSLYYEEAEEAWQQADQNERLKIKRKAANLIILADQFEEFFTNPENYNKGVPSQEATLVTNLLLETARIALEDNLPIYVVMTMRSDFIGQCAAFRGLPEYIGFSQFFVPRLNRKQLQEVIEDPAMLSGNTISRRLTERLIEDLTEGADQLPILQHALTQIWKKASEKDETMDLIHYAMVGGMDFKELPSEERARINQWFGDLPAKIRECYDKPGLQNVLNTHANIITNQVVDYVREKSGVTISEDEGKAVIKSAFKCLTKINQGRAVRDRMTLLEISQIIDQPHFDAQKVATILNIFRDQDNTLLKPFIADTPVLENDSVLDITHESLIRNWKHLDEWAHEEFENHTIFLDFRQQLERWITSGKSPDFLLSIGPLTYFENWFDKAKPNQHWIARYEADKGSEEDKLKRSHTLLLEAKEFLKRSSRKHFVTRTVMRYGPKKIALVLGVIIFLTASSFMVNNYVQQQSSVVRKLMVDQSLKHNNDPSIEQIQKVAALAHQLRLGEVSIKKVVANLANPKERLNIPVQVATYTILEARDARDREIYDCFSIADSILSEAVSSLNPQSDIQFILEESNDLSAILDYANYYVKNDTIHNFLNRNAQREAQLVKYILQNKPTSVQNSVELNGTIEYALNHQSLTMEDIQEIVNAFSPFEQKETDSWVNEYYAADKLYTIKLTASSFKFGGLYQELAYLYASLGNENRVQQCLDSIMLYREAYPDKHYLYNGDNAFNIAYYFVTYNHQEKLDAFVNYYCSREGISPLDFYEKLTVRSDVYYPSANKLDMIATPFANENFNSNLAFSDSKTISFFSEKLRSSISNSAITSSVKDFKLAISYKNEGIFLSKLLEDSNLNTDRSNIENLFSKAFEAYGRVDSHYLDEIISVVNSLPGSGGDINLPRRYLFLYPDFRIDFSPFLRGLPYFFYKSPSFMQYTIAHNRFNSLYKSTQEFSWIEEWISTQNVQTTFRVFNAVSIPYDLLVQLEKLIQQSRQATALDFNLLYLTLGNEAARLDNKELATKYYHQIDPSKIKKYFTGATNNVLYYQDCRVLRMISYAVSDLTRYGDFDWAYALTKSMGNPINRSSIYAFAARTLVTDYKTKGPLVDQLIDSSYQEMRRVHNVDDQPNRIVLAGALALRNEPHDIEEAFKVIKNVRFKQIGIWMICRGLAFNDEFYKAYHTIPENLSDDDIMGYFFEIYNYCEGDENQSEFWKKIENARFIGNDRLDYIP